MAICKWGNQKCELRILEFNFLECAITDDKRMLHMTPKTFQISAYAFVRKEDKEIILQFQFHLCGSKNSAIFSPTKSRLEEASYRSVEEYRYYHG